MKNLELADKYYQLAMDVSDRYFKGFALFLAINAVLIGYLINSIVNNVEIAEILKARLLISGIIINVLFFACTLGLYIFANKVYRTYRNAISRFKFEFDDAKYPVLLDLKYGYYVFNIIFISILLFVIWIIIVYFLFLY